MQNTTNSIFQISSRARHLRYVFFIDETITYDVLFKLVCSCQNMWGGRYNPIIPVKDNIISDAYIELIKFYDPDYVFYSDGIDPEIIKNVRAFNPNGYFNFGKEDIRGIEALYFLSQFDSNSKIIYPESLKNEGNLVNFFKLNFNISHERYFHEPNIIKQSRITTLDANNFNELNKVIHLEKPINRAELSRLNLNTPILRNLEKAHYDDFEIVLSNNGEKDDLIYFWNRHLYQCQGIMLVTLDELNTLSDDKYFGGVLYDMSISNQPIYVTSTSLNQNEIENLISTKLNPIAFHRRFVFKDSSGFPFQILDSNGSSERNIREPVNTQTIGSEMGLFHLPKLSFVNKIEYFEQKWVVDVDLKKISERSKNSIKYPLTTNTRYIFKDVNGRVNNSRNLSIIISNHHNKSDSLEITIPIFTNLLHQLISNPIIHGEQQRTKFQHIAPHDPSNKLIAFLKLFNFDFSAIDDFFTDKFWVDLLEQLILSDKAAGDTISFNEIKVRCIDTLKKVGIELTEKGISYQNEENLTLGLKETLKELCNYNVFLKGFNLKCPICSSKFWYHIKDVNQNVNCKGCFEDFVLPIEPEFAYKLNDLIKNNIYSTKASRDGNLAVIRTIVTISNNSYNAFEYSPQINLYTDYHTKTAETDIDIFCLADGQLIIGEVKHNSAAFFEKNNKTLHNLAEIAKEISPDIVILSCYQDSNGKLEKAKKSLDHYFKKWNYKPSIKTILLHTPDDFHLGAHRYFFY